jgi:hypothetical protein
MPSQYLRCGGWFLRWLFQPNTDPVAFRQLVPRLRPSRLRVNAAGRRVSSTVTIEPRTVATMFQQLQLFCPVLLLWCSFAYGQRSYLIADGWARTKVNAVIFRRNALCTFGDQQVAAFYNAESKVVLAKRTLNSEKWELKVTSLQGRTKDAHNCICLAFDGAGYLHLSWDHHGDPLRYCRSVAPLSLELGPKESMLGTKEQRVTYPEFYRMPDGDLLLFYRDGASGNGNLVLNRYEVKQRRWLRLQDNLIDGEGKRNAYWQVAVDR